MTHHHDSSDNESANRAQHPDWRDSTATLHSFHLGTGHSILTTAVSPLLHSTVHELLLVTCFWSPSTSSTHLRDLLLQLSAKALALNPDHRIRVRLCFSSTSVLQKLRHTPSLDGHVLTREEVVKGLGLPDPGGSELRGLDLRVKSVFQLPFSVMHPKFVVVDRRYCVLPSCNVSWERWFEGGLVVGGAVVGEFVRFWREFWGAAGHGGFQVPERIAEVEGVQPETEPDSPLQPPNPTSNSHLPISIPLPTPTSPQTPTVFLTHPPHRNPRFHPYPFPFPAPPPTPLNTYLLHLLNRATHNITISTPNLTSAPAIAALKTAIARGVNVEIYTDRNVMVAEQIVTAGCTTSRRVEGLVRWHGREKGRAGGAKVGRRPVSRAGPSDPAHDEARASLGSAEEGLVGVPAQTRLGGLRIRYFDTAAASRPANTDADTDQTRPEHLHLKMTAIDVVSDPVRALEPSDASGGSQANASGAVVVLGSGNMDRASWYTSQEIGLAIEEERAAEAIVGLVRGRLDGWSRVMYDE